MKFIDRFLNSITMYRLVLHCLRALVLIAFICNAFNLISFNFVGLLLSLLILIFISVLSNKVFAHLFKVQTNTESYIITALILFLILAPPATNGEAIIIALTAFIATASKYIFSVKGRHIFNPVAIALVIINVAGSGQAIWWIGSSVLLPFTFIAGLLILRKIRRFPLFISFVAVALIEIIALSVYHGTSFSAAVLESVISWPLVFFGTVMLTEPATMPSSRNLQIAFGVIVAIIFGSQFNIGPFFATPEFALCIGNIFALAASYRPKLRLRLKEKEIIGENIYQFSFSYPNSDKQPFVFIPGQYMEWTFAHTQPDSRGNRRYFTIASSPTESDVKVAIRFQENGSSSFKNAMTNIKEHEEVLALSLTGDFIMPIEKNKKMAFIAGGIGITPFRSMIKYLIDKKEKRDIVLFYAANSPKQFVYKEIFDEAKTYGVRTNYAVSIKEQVPENFDGIIGLISKEILQKQVQDFAERIWYISGPNTMVETYKNILLSMGVLSLNIKKDYFPGF